MKEKIYRVDWLDAMNHTGVNLVDWLLKDDKLATQTTTGIIVEIAKEHITIATTWSYDNNDEMKIDEADVLVVPKGWVKNIYDLQTKRNIKLRKVNVYDR